MRHLTKVHAVEAFRLPKGVIVTVKHNAEPLVRGDGGDWLTIHQCADGGGPVKLEVLNDKAFSERYEPSVVAVELGALRPRGGRKTGKKQRSKVVKSVPTVQSRSGGSIAALPSEAKREKCRALFEEKGMKLTEIAAQEGVKYHTLFSWKTNGDWEKSSRG